MGINFVSTPNGLQILTALLLDLESQSLILNSLHAAQQTLRKGGSHSLKYNRVLPFVKFIAGSTSDDEEKERRRVILAQLERDALAMCASSFTVAAVLKLAPQSFDTLCSGLPDFVNNENMSAILEGVTDFMSSFDKSRMVINAYGSDKRKRRDQTGNACDPTCKPLAKRAYSRQASGHKADTTLDNKAGTFQENLDAVTEHLTADPALSCVGYTAAISRFDAMDKVLDSNAWNVSEFGSFQEDDFTSFGMLHVDLNANSPQTLFRETSPLFDQASFDACSAVPDGLDFDGQCTTINST